MPPRFTYWTIVLDGVPTAFRSAKREDLLPTLKQLQGKNPSASLKWFARGRVWESPDEARGERERGGPHRRGPDGPHGEDDRGGGRGKGWRPGGEHRDPREKFKKETFQARKRREKKAAALARQGGAPWPRQDKPPGRPREERPREGWKKPDRPPGERPREPWRRDRPPEWKPDRRRESAPREDRPREGWKKPDRPPGQRPREPWRRDRPPAWKPDHRREGQPREDRPRAREERPREDRPRHDRAREERPREDRPRHDRPREGWKPAGPKGAPHPRADERRDRPSHPGSDPRRKPRVDRFAERARPRSQEQPPPDLPNPPVTPEPERPRGPDRPPAPSENPPPERPSSERIKVVPEPPERAGGEGAGTAPPHKTKLPRLRKKE
jgi:23S rRNA pseudouridine2605 synthase